MNRFQAFQLALDIVRRLRPLLKTIREHDRDLESQLRRAASSAVLNLAEGAGRSGASRRHHFSIARGSALESHGAVALAEAAGYVSVDAVTALLRDTDRLGAMIYGLLR